MVVEAGIGTASGIALGTASGIGFGTGIHSSEQSRGTQPEKERDVCQLGHSIIAVDSIPTSGGCERERERPYGMVAREREGGERRGRWQTCRQCMQVRGGGGAGLNAFHHTIATWVQRSEVVGRGEGSVRRL